VYDANAKLPSGILSGNINQYGDFDECLGVVSPDESIQGKYCLASVMVSVPKRLKYLRYLRENLLSLEPLKSRFEDVNSPEKFVHFFAHALKVAG
jgi:hypothetical protein